jgi:hypothetical protein
MTQTDLNLIEKFKWLLTQGTTKEYLALTEKEKLAFEAYKQKICQ